MNARARVPTPGNAFDVRDVGHLAHSDHTHVIISAAHEVQRILGVGLIERAYQCALALELSARSIATRVEAPFAVTYKGVEVCKQRIDLMVAFTDAVTGVVTTIVIEVKHFRGDEHLPRILAMLGSYVNLAHADLGLLLNFGSRPLGIKRVLPHPQA